MSFRAAAACLMLASTAVQADSDAPTLPRVEVVGSRVPRMRASTSVAGWSHSIPGMWSLSSAPGHVALAQTTPAPAAPSWLSASIKRTLERWLKRWPSWAAARSLCNQ